MMFLGHRVHVGPRYVTSLDVAHILRQYSNWISDDDFGEMSFGCSK